MHGNSQRKKVTQGGSQMSEAYIPFYFMPNKGKGMWAFWAGQSNCRKVRGGSKIRISCNADKSISGD